MARPHIIRGDIPPFSAPRSILALMLREMGSTYGDSPGGYVWAVLQPIGMIVILALGFSLLIKAPSLGTSFILFYATGYLSYDMYRQIDIKVRNALIYSKPMLAYPRVIWLDAILARFFLNLLTISTVICIVISVLLVVIDTRTIITITPILIGLSMSALVGLGVGMTNCLLIGLFPVWDIIWKILSRPLFIASGVIFIYEDMPRMVQDILWWNPLMHASALMRMGFYPTYTPEYVSLVFGFGVGFGLIFVGLLFLRAHHAKILNR